MEGFKIWRAAVEHTIDYEVDDEQVEFFFTKEEAEEWVDNESSRLFMVGHKPHKYIETISFEDFKEEATVEQFEGLFGVVLIAPEDKQIGGKPTVYLVSK